jgi:hypothetical protein
VQRSGRLVEGLARAENLLRLVVEPHPDGTVDDVDKGAVVMPVRPGRRAARLVVDPHRLHAVIQREVEYRGDAIAAC